MYLQIANKFHPKKTKNIESKQHIELNIIKKKHINSIFL